MSPAHKAVVRRLESVPLTWRLVAILLTILMTALVVTSGITAYLLKRELVQSTDDQLRAVAQPLAANPRATYVDPALNTFAFDLQPTDGSPGYSINPTGEQAEPQVPALPLDSVHVRTGEPFTVESTESGTTWRFIAGQYEDGSATFAVGTPMRGVNETISRFAVIATSLGLMTLVGSGVLGWFATRRAVRPLRRIEDVASAIAAGDLSRRVPERTNHDEVASLSDSLNVMLGRIEHSFTVQEQSEVRMRQFVADASHELRTPLATVQGYAELYRQGAVTSDEDVATAMGRIEGEAGRMSGLVEDLLMLARLDDERPLEVTEVDLVVLAAEVAHDARARAPHRSVTVRGLHGELAPVLVPGDDSRLRQVLVNLIGNALMHTEDDVPVEVLVGTDPADGASAATGSAVVEVRDHGPGIEPEVADRVFERFYREDKARSRARGGSGLGLAIVAAVVAQHGGRVDVRQTDGGGATFRVELPTAGTQVGPSRP